MPRSQVLLVDELMPHKMARHLFLVSRCSFLRFAFEFLEFLATPCSFVYPYFWRGFHGFEGLGFKGFDRF